MRFLRWLRGPSAAPSSTQIVIDEHREVPTTQREDVGPRDEQRGAIDDARWRYDKVMEAVTGADLKASIVATVQAAALGALLTTATPGKPTSPN
jgi:hypothetical protein